ncbi:MAG: Mov34/MPN/PAD-1 family protein [Candidatus Diapherotrites archaeon]|nr:Mov34/MPN/PAD-1 family protein [Candidatus Diapherotrites archaeon]MDZ4256595.1 Mov34/MPN/PAD-1 family protein [archaeon]
MPETYTISPLVLANLMMAAKKVYPDEFICLVASSPQRPRHISELVILPAEFGKTHSQIRLDLSPYDPFVLGIVHSHPSPDMRASSADRNIFARFGKIHLILGHPYSLSDFRAYDNQGHRVPLAIIE